MIEQEPLLQSICGLRRRILLYLAVALIVGYQLILLSNQYFTRQYSKISQRKLRHNYLVDIIITPDSTNWVQFKITVNSIICINQSVQLDGHQHNMQFIMDNKGTHCHANPLLAHRETHSSNLTESKNVTGQLDIKTSRRNIFFLETSCTLKHGVGEWLPRKGLVLNARQACAVESAARSNPSHNVYLLYTCPLILPFYLQSTPAVQQMLSYQNIFLVPINISEYIRQTPIEYLYSSSKLEKSAYPIEHTSDLLRLVTLWKYGGTYMDLDVIVIRALDDLGYNYAGYETNGLLGTGVINFSSDGVGHELVQLCLLELNSTFDGSLWSHNGPQLVTRVLNAKCGVGKLTKDNCGFTAYPPRIFYPVYYDLSDRLFHPQDDQFMANFEGAYAVHFWNKISHQMKLNVGSGAPYDLLARQNCPNVHAHCGDTM